MNEEATSLKDRGKVIRDPIHGLISLRSDEGYLLDLIDSPEFQRLRRIRQLGVSNITYPGAEHTRFAHSLGVMNFAGRILNHLRQRYQFHSEITQLIDNYERIIKAAALLHDTGHGPFSHMIERSFRSTAEHEARTASIITDAASHVNGILIHHKIDPNQVRSVIDGTFSVRFLRDIVSSQLDADRMDYLLRDAMMTGVEYGSYDAEWIIHAICLGRDPVQSGEAKPQHLRLCLDRSRGVHAAEQLIVARMHMSYQVYFHRVTRGWEAHLLCLFRLATKIAETNGLPAGTPRVVEEFFTRKGDLSHSDFLSFDEPQMFVAFQVWAEIASEDEDLLRLKELASTFLQRRKIFHTEEAFGEEPLASSFKEIMQLMAEGARDGIDYHHDDAKFRGYKDFGSSVVHEGTEEDTQEMGSEGIFLSDGDPSSRSIPVEEDGRALITPALIARKTVKLNRVYVNRLKSGSTF